MVYIDIAVWALHTTGNLHVGWAAAAHKLEGEDDHVPHSDHTAAADPRGRGAEQ